MKKYLIYTCLLLLMLAMTLTACGVPSELPPDPEPQTLIGDEDSSSADSSVAPSPATPFTLAAHFESTFHPAFGDYQVNLMLAPLLYESLFVLDETFTPTQQLCQSYTTSDDGLVWTFTLRAGVTFSDGTPLTGDIVATALLDAATPESNYAPRLADVASIVGADNLLIITLNSPNIGLPSLLDIPIPLGRGDRPLGTGPYVLQDDGLVLSLQLRERHWQEKTHQFDPIPLNNMRQTVDLLSAFDSSYITLVNTDLMATNAINYSGSYETWDYPTTGLIYLGFNTKEGATSSAKLRRTLMATVDRQSIVDIDYARHATATILPIHPASPLYDNLLAATADFNPAILPASLADITVPDSPLRLLVSAENTAKLSAAHRIADNFTALGIPTEVTALPWTEFQSALSRGDFDLYLAEILLTADFNISSLIATGGSLNYGAWSSGDTDGLLSLYRSSTVANRPITASNLFAHLLEQAPIIPICFKNGSILTQWGELNELIPTQHNVFWNIERWTVPTTGTTTAP